MSVSYTCSNIQLERAQREREKLGEVGYYILGTESVCVTFVWEDDKAAQRFPVGA